MRKKVTVIGAGNVGATCALHIIQKELADVVLIDTVEGLSAGKALDITEAAPLGGHDYKIQGFTNEYQAATDSDIVIITAGIPRKAGMSRDDLLVTNMGVVQNVTKQVAKVAPNAVLIIVTNPLDAMCHVALEASGFPKHRVVGMSGILDAARFAAFIAIELNVSVNNIQTFVFGGHGDSMVPIPSYATVAGIPVTELIQPARLDAIIQRTRNAGTEIVNLLKTGSAYYAPSYAIAEMAEVILKDKNKILPCAAYLQGEYGIHNLFIGVPIKLGKNGIEEIIQIKLAEEEQKLLHQSAAAVQKLVDDIKRLSK